MTLFYTNPAMSPFCIQFEVLHFILQSVIYLHFKEALNESFFKIEIVLDSDGVMFAAFSF